MYLEGRCVLNDTPYHVEAWYNLSTDELEDHDFYNEQDERYEAVTLNDDTAAMVRHELLEQN